MIKLAVTKLKSATISFWYFLILLLSHSNVMRLTNTCEFTINCETVNILHKTILVLIETITQCVDSHKRNAEVLTASTRGTADNNLKASPAPNTSKIAEFETKEMRTFILDSCEECLKLWIGNI